MLKALLRVNPVQPAGHLFASEPNAGSLASAAPFQRTPPSTHINP